MRSAGRCRSSTKRSDQSDCSAGFSRRMRFTLADQRRAGCPGASRVPVADLVLLGIAGTPRCPARAALLAAARRPGRRCRSWPTSVAASTSRAMNAGRPPTCSVLGQDVGRVRPQVRAEVFAHRACASSVKYSVSSRLVLRQAKYVYDCVKPSFASRYITFGRVNASARKITSGCSRLHLADRPIPRTRTAWCAGCRRERSARPASIQNRNTLLQLAATAPASRRVSKSNG